ncbi:hypothetical protein [Parafilimonas terrae]|uniref:Uncharacterized protein n=1 Tax=Parafilimonas terrae TaxID=1465490 RepID=A0A1I5YQ02_9BACT|nr:hypothetical protein [Parafilimonas terrae]SFQ46348.1 hypothetical protein SAMN05444277_113106 [Parafilimonas terrae]
MASPYEYIFFESDQVLTDNDLNKTFSYLDQQNRWTRNKLIGIGIVCGFDIINDNGIIEITKGCGVTSQGYLITQGDKRYTYYMPYTAPGQPMNPPLFDYPDTNMPFYKDHNKNKKIFLMLADDEYGELDEDDQAAAQPIRNLQTSFFNDYAVVLFLEASENDLKNCDMFDCNNNGERVSFIIRALLVAKKDLPSVISRNQSPVLNLPHQIYFKRFNVPYSNLQTANDIINAFAKLVDDFTLTRVANAYMYTYEKYKLILGEDDNPFTDLLKQLQSQRDAILKSNRLFIQYFYDFVDDLVKAYYEFVVKVSEIISACCPDENLFPLHLVLGEASRNTDFYITDAYRQYFIYSPIFEKNYGEISEAVFLFQKMKLLVRDFTILSSQTFANAAIKITPSQYEHLWLSQRAIPYYYRVNENGSELYKAWSYYKTTHGNAAYNLSYNGNLYSSNDAVLNPLLYDIEYYNFLRVEGHIGKNYTTVLNDIVSKIQDFNLPIDVVAIQAGGDTTTVSENDPQCSFQDLNSVFNVVRSDLYCMLGKLMCYAASQPYIFIIFIPPIIFGDVINTDINVAGASNIKAASATAAAETDSKKETIKAADESLKAEKLSSDTSKISAAAGSAATGSVKAEATANTGQISAATGQLTTNLTLQDSLFINLFLYQKGTFLKQQACYSKLPANSVGVYYINHIPSGSYFFSSFDPSNLSNNFLTIVDLIEEIISTLYFTSLSTFNVDNFNAKMTALQNYLMQLNDVYLQYQANTKDPNYFANYEENMGLFNDVIHSCYTDKFTSLKNEYTARVTRLKQQMMFSNYYNQHRGMEHKAGVPKGGTFIIVYNAPAVRTPSTAGIGAVSAASTSFTASASRNVAAATNITSKSNPADVQTKQNITNDDLKLRLQSSFSDIIAKDPTFIDRAIATLSPALAAAVALPAIPDYAVIADFYVPYLCCSDCAPVTYVLPPEDKTVFDIQPRTFLYDDAHNYPFTTSEMVTPADFDTTTNPGKLNLLAEDDKLLLHPAMDINTTLKTTLTYDDIKLDITIIKPDASFTVNVQSIPSGEIMIALAAKNIDATSYEWLVNGKEGIFESKAIPAAVSLSVLQRATDANEFNIELTVTYVLNDTTSSDSKTGILTSDIIKRNVDKGPFEPEYKEADTKIGRGTTPKPTGTKTTTTGKPGTGVATPVKDTLKEEVKTKTPAETKSVTPEKTVTNTTTPAKDAVKEDIKTKTPEEIKSTTTKKVTGTITPVKDAAKEAKTETPEETKNTAPDVTDKTIKTDTLKNVSKDIKTPVAKPAGDKTKPGTSATPAKRNKKP